MYPFARNLLATILVGGFVGLILFSCTNAKTGSEESDLSPKEQKLRDEYLAEIEIGRDMAGRLLSFYGSVGNQDLLGYVNQVGNYVASYSDYPDRRYMFAILESEAVNAYACPGGYILVTLGTLRAINSEAELAAVLGHEIAHVGKQHMFNTLKDMRKEELEKNATEGQIAIDKSMGTRMRQRPKPGETGIGSTVARYLSGSQGAGLNLLQAAKAGMNLIMEKGIDPQLEYEADREGVKYAIRAGYAPKGMIGFLNRAQKSQADELKRITKTHPSFPERIESVKTVLKNLKANEIVGATGLPRIKKMQNLLPEKKQKS